jgi:glycosyltransferase involved in cell wall biosynthesis
MKIVYLTNLNPFCENSASANRILSLLEGLSNYGAEVKLIITAGYRSRQEIKRFGKNGFIGNIGYQYICNIKSSNLWQRRFNRYVLMPLIQPLISKKIQKIVKGECNDILWTEFRFELLKFVVEIKKRNPHIKAFLEMNEYLDIYKGGKARIIHRIKGAERQDYFETKAFWAYDGIALMTRALIRHYELFPKPGPKLLHLPMTVDLNRFRAIETNISGFEKPYIAFVGVMDNLKDGVDILIEAFARIAMDFPKYKLYLVGPWNYDTPSHKTVIEKLNLQKRIFWVGEYSRNQIPTILMNANLLVLPRPNSKQAQGGFPTKLGEYLATGNPVCATRVGEIPDYLVDDKSVYFAEPGSVTSFADAIFKALSNPENAKLVGKSGRRIAELYFNKENQAKILYDFLKTIILNNYILDANP